MKILFDRHVARYVQESVWHSSQQLTPRDDGGILAKFELGNLEEVRAWVLSFGRHAAVLEPRELREQMLDELRALSAVYGEDPADQDRWQ